MAKLFWIDKSCIPVTEESTKTFVTHIIFRVSIVRNDRDDGVMDEEAESQHAAEAAECRFVHGNVFWRCDVIKIDVDAPRWSVITDDTDKKDDSDGAWKYETSVKIWR